MQAIGRRILASLTVGVGALALAPAASASITPSVTLKQSGTKAGSTVPLAMDLKFAPGGSDSPKNLTLSLPSGLLANSAVDHGACLHTHKPIPACQVGSGTATATSSGVPVSLPLSFDLVAPPQPGDLAGLVVQVDVLGKTSQLGSPGEVKIRSGADPRGVGLNIVFTDLPNTFSGLSISLKELKSTFNGLRLPTSCPATPATVEITANSYEDATVKSAHAPLHVTDCGQLAFTPSFKVTAVKDAGDHGVKISTDLTQPSKPTQATSRTVRLTLPKALTPNVGAALTGGILCTNPASGTCKPIGTASSTSPLYPTSLNGKAYLTGKLSPTGLLSSPAIAIVFPSPFALTINGAVDLGSNSTTFHDVPDILLAALRVTLAGGPDAVFQAFCSPASGTASAKLTSQNGDRTAVASSQFTVSGCAVHNGGRPKLASATVSGLAHGVPKLSFSLLAGKGAPKLMSFKVELPHGLSFAKLGSQEASGISVSGGKVRSIALKQEHLLVRLSRAVKRLGVTTQAKALAESASLKAKAKHHSIPNLKLVVVLKDAAGNSTIATRAIKS